MLGQRILSAMVGIPLVVGVVAYAPPWLFIVTVAALALVAQWELYRMFARVGMTAYTMAGLLLGGLVVISFGVSGSSRASLVSLALTLAVAGSLTVGLFRVNQSGFDWALVALTLLGVCYCGWLLGHAIWLRALPGGEGLILLGLWVTWCGEASAYLVGGRWGRHKLAPRISPGKTVEGAAVQLFVSVAAAFVAVWAAAVSPWHALGIGVTLGLVGQLGDLAESFLKRSAETKDAGRLIPGHGGLLDRLDSLLFTVPGLYYYLKLFVYG